MKLLHIKSFMRWLLAALAISLLASCGGGDNDVGIAFNTPNGIVTTDNRTAPSNVFATTLTGVQETPPNGSTAIATGVIIVDPDTRILKATVTTVGIADTDAHIHVGAPGVAGPIIFPLTQTPIGSGIWTTQVTLTETQLSTLKAGNYYFNVHSPAFPNGEIRGQILPQLTKTANIGITGTIPIRFATFTNVLTGSQQVPSTGSATAIGIATVDAIARTLAAAVTTTGIAGTAAHINAAAPGVIGPIAFPLIETFAGSGIWVTKTSLTDAQINAINAGNYYFEVLSAAFPNGEIRGQIVQNSGFGVTGTGTTGIGTTGIGTGTGTTSIGTGTGTGTGTIGIDTGTGMAGTGTGAM